jgi:hypothetical protein
LKLCSRACFVTTTVFQEKKLKRKGKTTNPIILGPMHLHWDGALHTYQRYFTHLASVIDTNISETLLSVNDIVVGSDEEKALVKAIVCNAPSQCRCIGPKIIGLVVLPFLFSFFS